MNVREKLNCGIQGSQNEKYVMQWKIDKGPHSPSHCIDMRSEKNHRQLLEYEIASNVNFIVQFFFSYAIQLMFQQ